MKRLFCLLLALILVLPTTACGVDSKPSTPDVPATTAPAATEPAINYEEILEKANAALEKGNFAEAFSLFAEAGEAGEADMKLAKTALKDTLFQHYHDHDLQKASAALSGVMPDHLSEEEYLFWVLEYIQGKEAEIATILVKSDDSIYSASEKCLENISALIDESAVHTLPESSEVLDQHYLNVGVVKLYQGARTNAARDYQDAVAALEKCSEGSEGQKLLSAVKALGEYRYAEGMSVLKTHFSDKVILAELLYNYRGEGSYKDDVNNILEYYSTAFSVNKDAFDYDTLLGYLESSKSNLTFGIDSDKYSKVLKDAQRDQLKEQVGSAPAGKVLILHRRKVYGSKETKLDIVFGLMEHLPEKYFPNSLEEVEYIILMDSTYAKKGKFQNGTVRILETTKLTTYDVTTGKKLTTASKKGTLDTVMYYYGTAPKYYSCGSPKMQAALIKAMEAISANIEK